MLIADMPEMKRAPAVLTMPPESSVRDAAAAMAAAGTNAVIVTRNSHIDGIFTERDLLNKVVAQSQDPSQLRLSDVMTRDVVTAQMNDQVAEALQLIDKASFRHMPVVDEQGHLTGMITEHDFATYTFGEAMHRAAATTKAAMTAWYQPFLIALSVAIYTVSVIAIAAYWINQG